MYCAICGEGLANESQWAHSQRRHPGREGSRGGRRTKRGGRRHPYEGRRVPARPPPPPPGTVGLSVGLESAPGKGGAASTAPQPQGAPEPPPPAPLPPIIPAGHQAAADIPPQPNPWGTNGGTWEYRQVFREDTETGIRTWVNTWYWRPDSYPPAWAVKQKKD